MKVKMCSYTKRDDQTAVGEFEFPDELTVCGTACPLRLDYKNKRKGLVKEASYFRTGTVTEPFVLISVKARESEGENGGRVLGWLELRVVCDGKLLTDTNDRYYHTDFGNLIGRIEDIVKRI